MRNAIDREKRVKGWLRVKKIHLIVSVNPTWSDLSEGWYERHLYQPESARSFPFDKLRVRLTALGGRTTWKDDTIEGKLTES